MGAEAEGSLWRGGTDRPKSMDSNTEGTGMKERIEVLLSAEQIDKRMAELADELYQEFGDEQVELVCA